MSGAWSSRAWTRPTSTRRCPGAPQFAERLRAEVPRYSLRYFWKRAPQSLDELAENARLTAESFLGRAEGGLLADRMVPDWSALMVQFQNLDPFQHRAWRYLNVDETGIDDPAWNDAAAGVIRGLDVAIGLLAELAERRGAAVLVVSDHGFGPCLGRVHVNRILIEAGVARVPGLAGRLGRRARQAIGPPPALGGEARRPDRPLVVVRPLDRRAVPVRLEADPGLRPAPGHGGDGLPERDRPDAPGPRWRPPGRSTRPSPPPRDRAGRGPPSRDRASRSSPRSSRRPRPTAIDPAREGYPRPDRPARRAVLGPHQARAGARPGSRPTRTCPGTHRPEGIVALCRRRARPGPDPRGQPARHRPDDPGPLRPPDPRARRGPAPRRPRHALRHAAIDPPAAAVAGPHRPQFEYTPEEQAIIEQRLADLGYLE